MTDMAGLWVSAWQWLAGLLEVQKAGRGCLLSLLSQPKYQAYLVMNLWLGLSAKISSEVRSLVAIVVCGYNCHDFDRARTQSTFLPSMHQFSAAPIFHVCPSHRAFYYFVLFEEGETPGVTQGSLLALCSGFILCGTRSIKCGKRRRPGQSHTGTLTPVLSHCLLIPGRAFSSKLH